MTTRLEFRVRRLEERAARADEVEAILDALSYIQGMALLTNFIKLCKNALGEGDGGPSDEELRQIPLRRDQYEAALAGVPPGTADRLFAAILLRVEKSTKRAPT